MIPTGTITKRANEDQLPAQTIERDYVLTHLCAAIGAIGDPRLIFKGGTLLRLCYFDPYRYCSRACGGPHPHGVMPRRHG